MNRIQYLDGLRGVAILLVIGFHAYFQWREIVPYGDDFSQFPLFRFGYLGVQLFFLISGFVIYMSLDNSKNITSFIYRRWLRLFPGMLICSLFIYASASAFTHRPLGEPELSSLISGLSFVDPYIWLKLTGLELESIELAFWSLYVEFKFYVIAAIFYFVFGRKWLVPSIFLCFFAWLLSDYFYGVEEWKPIAIIHSLTSILDFKYFGWFAAGAAFYSYLKTDKPLWFICGLSISVISCVAEGGLTQNTIAALMVSALFAAAILNPKIQKVLSTRFILFFGFISYPLYLIHENMMISLTIQMDKYINFIPSAIYPVLALVFISTVAYIVAKYLEPRVKSLISMWLKSLIDASFKIKKAIVTRH